MMTKNKKETSLEDLISERNNLLSDLGLLEESKVEATLKIKLPKNKLYYTFLPEISDTTKEVFSQFFKDVEALNVTKKWLKSRIEELDKQINKRIK